MKGKKWTTVVLSVGLVFVMTLGTVNAEERKFKFRASGSGTPSRIDTNGDGVPASETRISGRSNLGLVSIQAVNETKLKLSNPADLTSVVLCQLPNGDPGLQFEIVQAHSVYRIGSGALLFGQASGGAGNCLRLTCFGAPGQILPGCQFSSNIVVNFIGGTGRFDGASGTIELNGTGTVLLAHPTGLFVAFSAEGIGTVIFP
jgi:hypothetical protein